MKTTTISHSVIARMFSGDRFYILAVLVLVFELGVLAIILK